VSLTKFFNTNMSTSTAQQRITPAPASKHKPCHTQIRSIKRLSLTNYHHLGNVCLRIVKGSIIGTVQRDTRPVPVHTKKIFHRAMSLMNRNNFPERSFEIVYFLFLRRKLAVLRKIFACENFTRNFFFKSVLKLLRINLPCARNRAK
jgi:hypothetical protein